MSDVELVDIFSETGERLGTITREEAELNNHIIQNVIIFIFNSVGEVWIQKRPKHKTFGGMWDASACGGIKKGEESTDAARREQQEEMGYVSELMLVESFINYSVTNDKLEPRKFFTKLFIARDDRTPQPNIDVDEFQCHEPSQLLDEIDRDPEMYVPTLGVELSKAMSHYHLLEN